MAGFFDELYVTTPDVHYLSPYYSQLNDRNSRFRRLPKLEPELRCSTAPSNPDNRPELRSTFAPMDPLLLNSPSRPQPLWLYPTFARHIVKGELTILCARPSTVELGEWIAH